MAFKHTGGDESGSGGKVAQGDDAAGRDQGLRVRSADHEGQSAEAQPQAAGSVDPLWSAVFAILAEAGSIKKGGHNEFHKYDYAKASDVLHRLQTLFAKHKVTIIKIENSRQFVGDGEALAITYRFFLIHESGRCIYELGDDPLLFTGMASCRNSKGGFDDKAANKCSTAATKYFLIDFFKIPTGDYDSADADGQEDRPAMKKKPVPAPDVMREPEAPQARPPEAIPHEGMKLIDWAVKFIAALNAATSASEIDEWNKLNAIPIKTIFEKGGALGDKINDAINVAYVKLGSTVH